MTKSPQEKNPAATARFGQISGSFVFSIFEHKHLIKIFRVWFLKTNFQKILLPQKKTSHFPSNKNGIPLTFILPSPKSAVPFV